MKILLLEPSRTAQKIFEQVSARLASSIALTSSIEEASSLLDSGESFDIMVVSSEVPHATLENIVSELSVYCTRCPKLLITNRKDAAFSRYAHNLGFDEVFIKHDLNPLKTFLASYQKDVDAVD